MRQVCSKDGHSTKTIREYRTKILPSLLSEYDDVTEEWYLPILKENIRLVSKFERH